VEGINKLSFWIQDNPNDASYLNAIGELKTIATSENFFYSRWNSTALAIAVYVNKIFQAVHCLAVFVVVNPICNLLRCRFKKASENFSNSLIRSVHLIKLVVILPLFLIGGVFAPEKIYGSMHDALEKSYAGIGRGENNVQKLEQNYALAQREIEQLRATISQMEGQQQSLGIKTTLSVGGVPETESGEAQEGFVSPDQFKSQIDSLKREVEELSQIIRGKELESSQIAQVTDTLKQEGQALVRDREALGVQIAQFQTEIGEKNRAIDHLKQQLSGAPTPRDLSELQSRLETINLESTMTRTSLDLVLSYYKQTLHDIVINIPQFLYPAMFFAPEGALGRYPIPLHCFQKDSFKLPEILELDASYKSNVFWLKGQEGSADRYDSYGITPKRVTGVAGIPEGMSPGKNLLQIAILLRLNGGALEMLVQKDQAGFKLPESGRENTSDFLMDVFPRASGGIEVEELLTGKPIYAGTTRSTDHAWDLFSSIEVKTVSEEKATTTELPDTHVWVRLDQTNVNQLNLEHRALFIRFFNSSDSFTKYAEALEVLK